MLFKTLLYINNKCASQNKFQEKENGKEEIHVYLNL